MKKDILFLCQFFYPQHNSSATLPYDTACFLKAQGFSVDVLCGTPKEYADGQNVPKQEVINGVNVKRINYIKLDRKRKISRLVNYFSLTLSMLFQVFSLRKYQAVFVYSNPPILPIVALLGKMLFKTKIIFVSYDVYPEVAYASNSLTPTSIISSVMQRLNKTFCKHVDHVITLTDEMKTYLLNNRPFLTAEKITTIANWAHEKKTEPTAQAYERFSYKEGQFVCSYFGNLGICQDVETFLQAAIRLKDDARIQFLIIGHGNKVPYVVETIQKEHLQNVTYHDFLVGEAFEQAVAISSCFVVSLENGLKGLCAPSKYYSYLQGGKPIIAIVQKDSYLYEEIKQENIGFAVELFKGEDLSQKLTTLQENPSLLKTMGNNASTLYENHYAMAIAAKKYKAVVTGILDKTKRSEKGKKN